MKILIVLTTALIFLIACNNTASYTPAENATDAGREFVRSVLDGDYARASHYLLKDSTNELLFAQQKSNYQGLSSKEKTNYKESSIRPLGVPAGLVQDNDSTKSFRYYHSANPADTTILRIVRRNGEWLVDLKSVIKM
jgi:hypothetical protein